MIERDIELTLHELARFHVRHEAPGDVREDARLVPFTTPQRRPWLPQSPRWTLRSLFGATKYPVAGAIVALFGGFLLAGILTQPRAEPVPAAGATAPASPAPSPVWARVTGGGRTPGVATDDALWEPGWNEALVYRLDAATGEAVTIPTPSVPYLLVPTDDAIWAMAEDGVHRIDRVSLSVDDSIAVAGGPAVAADGSLWLWSMGHERSSLVEIDLETRTVRNEYQADDEFWTGLADEDWSSFAWMYWIGATADGIWLHKGELPGQGKGLVGLDLETRELTDPTFIPTSRCCIAVHDAIWIPGPGRSGTLTRFDAATLEVTDTLKLGTELGAGIAADGVIWISGDGDTLHRVDPEMREVVDIPVATWNSRNFPPAFGNGAIWLGGPGEGVGRIDIDSLEVTHTGRCPGLCKAYDTLASDGVIWAHKKPGALYRIVGIADME